MDNSSSSSSAREEASMDGSEQEREYDYDIDDPEDDHHYDLDDLPEDEEEDEDEDDLEHYIRTVGNADYFAQPTAIEIPLFARPDPLIHSLPLRTHHSANGFHFDNLVSGDSPIVAVPAIRDDTLRAVHLDHLEPASPAHYTRLLENIESIRVDPATAQMTARPRHSGIPMLSQRWSRSTEPNNGIHPVLHPPRRSSSAQPSTLSLSVLSTLARRGPISSNIIERAPPNFASALTPHARAMDAIIRVIPPALPPSPEAASSSSDPPPQRRLLSPPLVPRPDHTSSSIPRARDGQPLTHLLNANLMRSVVLPPRSEAPLAAFSRSRSHHDRTASRDRDRDRDRDREKVPSHVARRWTYDPPLGGGDSLPPILDAEASGRSSRSSLRHSGTQNVASSEPSKSIQKSATKISQRIVELLTKQRAIDEEVRSEEKRVERRKRIEEEKLNENDEATEVSKEKKPLQSNGAPAEHNMESTGDTSRKTADESGDGELQTTQPPSSAEAPTTANANPAPDGGNTVDGSGSEDMVLTDQENTSDQENAANADGSNAIASDGVANDVQPESRPDTDAQTRDPSEPPSNASPDGGEAAELPNANEAGTTTGGIVFSALATERAAAAGISLDAPANENPEVVAAATESTGIDPAFLAALPEDMRTEILTQYYEQIRTNTEAQGGAASQPATTVNQDFLVALPPALRAEVLELEAEFQGRQENQNDTPAENAEVPQPAPPTGMHAAEMDNATFLATLAPELREEILLTSGEAFIESLPPNVAAEARSLREQERNRGLWRVVRGEGGASADARMLPQGVRATATPARRDGRTQPREPPIYRWKKTDHGWLRQRPNVEDEPDGYMQSEGLSALVDMLWFRHPSIDDNMLYQVFSFVCKTTESRYVVLDELVQLITSSSMEQDSKEKAAISGDDRSRYHGTAVLRGLKVLTMLCKNDSVVAEALLGLPKTEEDLKASGTSTEGLPSFHQKTGTSLSTLVSLLSGPLFKRSSSHLGLLVTLISAVAHSIPSSEVNPSTASRSRRQNRNRPFLDRASLSQSLGDPLNMLIQGAEEEDPGVFDLRDVRDEEHDEDIDSDDPFESAVAQPMASVPSSGANENGNAKDKEAKEEEESIAVEYRVPVLRESELVDLAKVLLQPGCSDRTYDKTTRTIGLLGEHPTNRRTFVDSLISIATESGHVIKKEYDRCIAAVTENESRKTQKDKSVLESPFFMVSASSELTFLRVVKTLSAILKHNMQREAKPGDAMDGGDADGAALKDDTRWQHLFKQCMLYSLKDLWSSLDRLLSLVSEEANAKDKRESTESRATRAASSVLNPDRMKPSGRSLSPMLARLSPMIEAFLVTHVTEDDETPGQEVDKAGIASPASSTSTIGSKKAVGSSESNSKAPEEGGLDGQLAAFVERHRDPINSLLRANPTLLETSFKGALRHPHAIDFDNKKAYFRNVIRRRSSEAHAGTMRISVRRDRVFDDSYHQLKMRTPEQLKGRLHVQFTGEEGVDAGGVTREWYTILARQIFDPNYVLFTRSAAKAATYQPDKRSYINREHLDNFRFVGRIIGKAIYDGQLLDAYFTRSFYKHILGLKPTYHDLEAMDPEYYKSLRWMLENNIQGVFEYTMSADYDEFGKQTVVDLMPNGRNILVTEENKADYVRLVTDIRMTKAIEKQIEAFKEGFYELIPHEDCKIFNELELELLMSGLPDIDVSDLKANVEYTGYTASSPQINWFWRCVGKMDQEDLARLVMFVTGTSKVPLEGFSQLQGMNGIQKFQIHRVGGNTLRLPSAHTCFNQLDLPEYSTAEILSERLLRAARECHVGFGFA